MDNSNTGSTLEDKLNIAIYSWIPLREESTALCINVPRTLQAFFEEHRVRSCVIDIDRPELLEAQLEKVKDAYDYIFAMELLEKVPEPASILARLKGLLNNHGILYLGTDNRLGLRYFCGDIDPATNRSYDGLEGYKGINTRKEFFKNRLYSQAEIKSMLSQAGMEAAKCYSVLPNLEAAQLIYAEDTLPDEALSTRYMPMYRDPSRIFLREEWMYDDIIANGMFHQMANSYLFEYHRDELKSLVNHVTISADRGDRYACATIIEGDKVIKKALHPDGLERLKELKAHDDDLRAHGVPVIDSQIIDDQYVMPRVEGEILEKYLRQLLIEDKDKFLNVLDAYYQIIKHSSEQVESCDNDKTHMILSRCYLDLVPLNCFYKDGQFLFYDQEFCMENESYKLIMWRTIVIIYDGSQTLNAILPIFDLMARYGLSQKDCEECGSKAGGFLSQLRSQEELEVFNAKHYRDIAKVNVNRRKVEHTMIDWTNEKERLKETCFDDLNDKEIYVFGSGRYADEFICMYRYDYKIAGVIDNNPDKQGSSFYDYPVSSSDILVGRNPETFKVIVCVKNCQDILQQLYDLNVRYTGVFDINYFYPGRQKNLPGKSGLAPYQEFYKAQSAVDTGASGKHYHVGYIAGVFDLYHLGHLNMFRRAKEMCDYLIVGVVSDQGVRINKKKEPFIPFEERIEMVRSCKYVDEAVEIPFVYCRTPEAFRKYHFDVQFSGSDYENDPGWLAMKDFLEEHGSTLEFLSYTQQTSSTKIKSLIDKGLM